MKLSKWLWGFSAVLASGCILLPNLASAAQTAISPGLPAITSQTLGNGSQQWSLLSLIHI